MVNVDIGVQVGETQLDKMVNKIYRASMNRDKLSRQFDETHFITKNFIKRLWTFQKHKCHYCDKIMHAWDRNLPKGCTIERLDNNFGHTIKNCVLAHKRCNVAQNRGKKKHRKTRFPLFVQKGNLFANYVFL